ncbi:MAG: hypothetical protein ACRECA_03195 [Pseudolabrys sp.]
MLVARRDPPFHAGDAAPADLRAYPDAPPHRLTRFVTVMQLLGSLVAVPVGLASAYSLYHATFSVEASCQSLRAGIVAMLDKSVDATTRRMLVRRDVVTFEQNCGAVDPDATTAFKALLAAEKTAAVPASTPAPAEARLPNSETPPKVSVRKAEPRPLAKQPQTAEAIHRNPTVSDTQWVDAVRQALLTHSAEPPLADAAKAPIAVAPSLRPLQQEPAAPVPVVVAPAPAPVTTSAAPPSVIPATPQDSDDHPVPPGVIPDSEPAANVAAVKPDEPRHSRIGGWIAKIPLLGPVVENGRQ